MAKPVTPEKARKISRSMPMPKSLEKGFVRRGWTEELPGVFRRTAALLNEHGDASSAQQTHLNQILPTIAFYEAAKRLTGSREAALAFMEEWAFVEIARMAAMMRPLMKLGLYRLIPRLGPFLLRHMFCADAGFDSRPVPDAPAFSVDMTRCPYLDACTLHGVPELTQFFCRADDVTYGNLHPRLVWARTQTLGTGGSCCDFRLHVKEK